jgi:hypothetical protein
MDEKQIDAMIAQLPSERHGQRSKARRILLVLALVATVLFILRSQLPRGASSTVEHAAPSQFPLAVCGNGILEPSEDCELDDPDCPPDCIQRKK